LQNDTKFVKYITISQSDFNSFRWELNIFWAQ